MARACCDRARDPARPYVVYLCSSGNIARNDGPEFVQRWIASLRASEDERLRNVTVVVRPHPNVRKLSENRGFLHVACDLDEHNQLAGVLDEDEEGAARRRAFVESFVRPRGLDRPAAPIGAEAIEELASIPARNGAKPGTYLLRGLLSVEAGLNAVYNRRR